MKKFLFFTLLLALTACSTPNQKPDAAGIPKASKSSQSVSAKSIPNIALTDIKTGSSLNFSEIEKPIVVTFWASWCTTCRKEFSLWRDKALADDVIGINVQDAQLNDQLRTDAYNLMKENGTVFPSFVDTDEVLTSHLGLVGLPVTIVVASDGTIIDRHDGLMTKQQMLQFIAQTKN
jgi:thiol-disulfide isomerase/thioredoxin